MQYSVVRYVVCYGENVWEGKKIKYNNNNNNIRHRTLLKLSISIYIYVQELHKLLICPIYPGQYQMSLLLS